MATTLTQITDEFYSVVNQPSSSGVYPLTYVQQLANDIQDEICREWKWAFLSTKTQFNVSKSTSLNAAVATTDVTIDLGTVPTHFPTAGAIITENDIITYTGKTASTLTGVTNIDVAHVTGAKVELLYALPTDFNRMPHLSTTRSNAITDYIYIDKQTFDNSRTQASWTIEASVEGVEYIRIRADVPSDGDVATFEYTKESSTMNTTTPVNATIPDSFALKVIPQIMAGRAMITRGDDPDSLGQNILAIGQQQLVKMKKYYGSRVEEATDQVSRVYQSRRGLQTPRRPRTFNP